MDEKNAGEVTQANVDRDRKRAIRSLLAILLFCAGGYQFALWRNSESRSASRDESLDGTNRSNGFRTTNGPKFLVDVTKASKAELRLLPNVGELTADSWTEYRNQEGFKSPQSVADLENLPRVGPVRAKNLAPHLLEARIK